MSAQCSRLLPLAAVRWRRAAGIGAVRAHLRRADVGLHRAVLDVLGREHVLVDEVGLAEQFVEVLFAPGYDEQAMEALARKASAWSSQAYRRARALLRRAARRARAMS